MAGLAVLPPDLPESERRESATKRARQPERGPAGRYPVSTTMAASVEWSRISSKLGLSKRESRLVPSRRRQTEVSVRSPRRRLTCPPIPYRLNLGSRDCIRYEQRRSVSSALSASALPLPGLPTPPSRSRRRPSTSSTTARSSRTRTLSPRARSSSRASRLSTTTSRLSSRPSPRSRPRP